MSEFDTITLYKDILQTIIRDTALRAAWWGADHKGLNAVEYADKLAKEKIEWIAKELAHEEIWK